jgi:hypothetical protein
MPSKVVRWLIMVALAVVIGYLSVVVFLSLVMRTGR